ncbi:integrase [Aneurinibacillus sp. XH2]|nr:integrase [Aneurinibacillus sp. XH2]
MIPKEKRFEIIHTLRSTYRLCWLLEIAKVSRQGYHKWLKPGEHKARRKQLEEELKAHIIAIHTICPFYGYPRMTVALRKEGYDVNHKRVYRLMKDLDLRSVIRKKRRFFGKQPSVVYPNLLARQFKAEAPNQKWVTDITYLPFQNQFLYLSAIQDLYNNEIVAYHISERNDLKLVLDTLDKAKRKRNVTGSMTHSDQGFQYTSRSYNRRIEQWGMVGSHSRKGNCLDNACIESFFSHLKTEKLYMDKYMSMDELHQAIGQYITFYNSERFQKKLGYLSPIEYREKMDA